MTFSKHRFMFDPGDIININAEGIRETYVAQQEHICSLCSLSEDKKECAIKKHCNKTHFTKIYYG